MGPVSHEMATYTFSAHYPISLCMSILAGEVEFSAVGEPQIFHAVEQADYGRIAPMDHVVWPCPRKRGVLNFRSGRSPGSNRTVSWAVQ
jgi:hypothetical protein